MSWFQTPLPMSPDAIIRRALAEAPAAGKDYLTQTEETVRAVLWGTARSRPTPDRPPTGALSARCGLSGVN